MPKLVLQNLKRHPVQITSVTSMTDDGGSTGELRKELGILPPGDIRRHLLAFSEAPQWKKDLWQFRFGRDGSSDGHSGHNLANVFMAGLEKSLGNYEEVLLRCREFLEVPEHLVALPAVTEPVTLCAELQNGEIIRGESEIDEPKLHDPHLKIKRIFLDPETDAFPPVMKAITEAEVLVLGPGDLYSSVLACLLPRGIKEAVAHTSAKKILVCNFNNKLSETPDFSVVDFAETAECYMGSELDMVMFNNTDTDGACSNQVRWREDYPQKFIGTNLYRPGMCGLDGELVTEKIWELIKA